MSSSSSILTRFKTAATILTSRFANSIFGGLKGSDQEADITLASMYGEYDPLLSGHMHDGQGGDGHAQKINLGGTGTDHHSSAPADQFHPHVRGELQHVSLADASVYKNNVFSIDNNETNSNLIPWRVDLGSGNYKYYLNLTEYTSYVIGSIDLDQVATVDGRTDQRIGLGSDTGDVNAQLQIIAQGVDNPSSSEYSHIKLINKNTIPDWAFISSVTDATSPSLWLYAHNGASDYGPNPSTSPDEFNGIKIYPYNHSSAPAYGIYINSTQGDAIFKSEQNLDLEAADEARISGDNKVWAYSDLMTEVQSNRNDGDVGLVIETLRNSSLQMVSSRTSGFGPGINLETKEGSPIHIGTQTYVDPWTPSEEIRFTSEQINIHPPLRSGTSYPINSYPNESDFINIYDRADVDSGKNAVFTFDLGNKTSNPSNSDPANSNAKIYIGQNAKQNTSLITRGDASIHIRDGSGPKIYLDDLTSGLSVNPTKPGIQIGGQVDATAQNNQTNIFSEILGSKEKPALVPVGSYGGKLEFKVHGSDNLISGASTSPYTTGSYASMVRAGINYNGNMAIGKPEREQSSAFHTAKSTNAFIKKDYERLLSVQTETAVESDGEGEDSILSFSQTYSQENNTTSYKIKNLRYVEIEAPDFVNKVTSNTVTPEIAYYTLNNHTDNGSQLFRSKTAAFMNFKHPVRDEVTDPTSAPYSMGKSAIDEHPMLMTNISSPTYVSTAGVSLPSKPMNSIPVSSSQFGGASDAGHYADVMAWMKVYVDEWNSGSSTWEKVAYYVPLCSLRKA